MVNESGITNMTALAKFSDDYDLLYVSLREGKVAVTKEFGDHRLVDLDASGVVLGAEFIGLDGEIDLCGLPEEGTLLSAVQDQVPSHLKILTNLVRS